MPYGSDNHLTNFCRSVEGKDWQQPNKIRAGHLRHIDLDVAHVDEWCFAICGNLPYHKTVRVQICCFPAIPVTKILVKAFSGSEQKCVSWVLSVFDQEISGAIPKI